jgi:peptide/nickel transport system substrate-binding protein
MRTLAVLLLWLAGVSGSQAQMLRLALPELPPGLGYPYRVMTMPTLYTVSAMFDGLTRIDSEGVVQPWLATSWTQTTPTTWTLTLRDDVVFHSGRHFTADAVAHVVNLLATREGMGEAVATELAFLHSARALDTHTVEIRTDYPIPILPRFLPVLHIIDPVAWEQTGQEGFATEPVGTGPFMADSFSATSATFRAHKNGWRPPQVEGLEIYAVPEATARVQALVSGSVDVALALGPDDRMLIESIGGTFLGWRSETVRTISFVLTGAPSPLDDIRVREALNLAVDRQAIIDNLLGGATVAANQGATPAAEGYNPGLPAIPYDPDRARTLLAEAGYADGFEFEVEAVIGASGTDRAMYQQVAQYLRDIGVTMTTIPVSFAHLFDHFERGEWHGNGFGMIYSSEPVIDSIRPLRNNSCLRPAPWYCDRNLSELIERALTESNLSTRVSLKQHILARYREEAPAIFLWAEPRFAGLAKGLTGYNDVHGFVSYDTITLSREE